MDQSSPVQPVSESRGGTLSLTEKDKRKSLYLICLKMFVFSPTKIKINAILFMLPFEEISLRPELSSPPRFRIQGGYPERDGRRRTKDEGNPRV